jgi:hypothetical protein
MPEIAPLEALLPAPAPPQAHSDAQLVEIWLHGRSSHAQRFADSFGELAPASRYRVLSAVRFSGRME